MLLISLEKIQVRICERVVAREALLSKQGRVAVDRLHYDSSIC